MARQLTTRRSKKTLRQQGFTLIELMVVTAVAGVLGAVAVPKFLGARDIAEAKAEVSAAVGLGKECLTWVQTSGEGLAKSPEETASTAPGAPVVVCGLTAGSVTHATAFSIPDGVTTIDCLGTKSAGGETGVTITVNQTTGATCAFT